MKMIFRLAALVLAVFAASWTYAAEIMAPSAQCVLKEGRVTVIGLAPKAEKGKAEYGGQSTSFRVKDDVWTTVINLNPGVHEVVFSVGSETVKVKWSVSPDATKGFYKYHPGIDAEKCSSCHETTARLSRDDDVSSICSHCHKTDDKAGYVHGPVAMGLCAACHDPHGSSVASGLRMDVIALCQDCHNQPVSEKHRKNAGDEVCTECHNPHTSSKQFMLR